LRKMQQLKVIHSSRLMKKIFSLLCFVILSLAVGAQGYSIKISLENSKDTIAYLGHHFGNQRYLNDTTSVIAGTAIFEGEEDLPEGLYFYYSPNAYFEFVVSDQQFEIQTKSPTFVEDFVSIGSEENEIFHQLQTVTLKNQRIIQGLQTRYEEVKEDSTAAKKVRKEIEIASEKFSAERKEVADAHPESFVGRFIRALSPPSWADFHPELEPKERYREYKAHYLDGIDITDEALLRSPAYHPLINEYMDKVTIQNPDSIISSADFILDSVIDNPTMFRYALVTITQKYETSEVMGMDKVFVHLADKYYLTGKADWISDEVLTKIGERVAAIKPNLIGSVAPDLVLADTSLVAYNFKNSPAKYSVLYFYDPDCGHCKKTTPILHTSYLEALQAKGVEVFAICIGADVDAWKNYVKENEWSWVNVIDAKGSRKAYDIRSTPTIYVLDQEKKIVAKRIGAEDIERIIDILDKDETGS